MRRGAATARDILLLAVASAGAWWAWLGWDTSYYTNPETGDPAGPYMPWQVIGCVLTLLVVAVLGHLRLNPVVVGVVMTLAFTVSYAVTAISSDDSGLAGVGVVLVFLGMAFASTVIGLLAFLVRILRRRPDGNSLR